ncbi:MAG: hypothetical protein OEW30_02370 [Acidimicrobiia bacterium]|nr:hypothetical protein [Acidimicrobiia bacterium]
MRRPGSSRKPNLGTTGDSIAGILGGGIGGQVLAALGAGSGGGSLDLGSILSSISGGGVGGGIEMAMIGLIGAAMSRA